MNNNRQNNRYRISTWNLFCLPNTDKTFVLASTCHIKETRYENYLAFTLLPTYNQPRQFYLHLSLNLAGHGRVLEYGYSDCPGPCAPEEYTAGKGLENLSLIHI